MKTIEQRHALLVTQHQALQQRYDRLAAQYRSLEHKHSRRAAAGTTIEQKHRMFADDLERDRDARRASYVESTP